MIQLRDTMNHARDIMGTLNDAQLFGVFSAK